MDKHLELAAAEDKWHEHEQGCFDCQDGNECEEGAELHETALELSRKVRRLQR